MKLYLEIIYWLVIILMLLALVFIVKNYNSEINKVNARCNDFINSCDILIMEKCCYMNPANMNAKLPIMNNMPIMIDNVTAKSQPKKNPINPVNR